MKEISRVNELLRRWMLGCVLGAALVAVASVAGDPDPISDDMNILYKKYPSLRTNMRPDVLGPYARKVLGEKRGERLLKHLAANRPDFETKRAAVVKNLSKANNARRAVVSGQSVTGMVAAAILARSGYEVDVYEVRGQYTRNIQWAGRQALVDELASIDPALADKFLERVAKPLERGSVHISSDGSRKHYDQSKLLPPDPTRVPTNGTDLMREPSLANMEARVFEETLQEYLETQPNVRRHNGAMKISEGADGMYAVTGHGKPDLVVLAEGGGGRTKDALGITSVPTSPKRLQIAGVVHIDGGGVMAKKWREEAGDVMITGTMSRKGSGKTWVVADIDPAKIVPAASFGTETAAPAYRAERQRLIDEEFRRLAAEAMEVPLADVRKAKIEGAVQNRAIETFELQQRLSDRATRGKNVVGFADVVGNNHWSVGGGMQTGVVGHGERFKTLLLDMDNGVSRNKALNKYSQGVFADTVAWGEIGINDFYPNLDRETSKKAFNESIRLWQEKKVSSPDRAMQLMTPGGHMSKVVKPVQMPCKDIVRRVLGEL